MIEISGYHAHIYFDPQTKARARVLCEALRDRFDVPMGRMHDRPIGPHPGPSCQLAFAPGQFAELVPWLALHRDGLTVFVHPETGNDLADHRDHAIWMGAMPQLHLGIFG